MANLLHNFLMGGQQNSRAIQNQPTSLDAGEDLLADTDEPPDEHHSAEQVAFHKTRPAVEGRKLSLLTQALHTPEEVPTAEITDAKRGMSTTSSCSTVSTADLTSDGGFTSPGTRTSSPSPTLPPASFRQLSYNGTQKPAATTIAIRHDDGHISPLHSTVTPPPTTEPTVEAGLGRKRCITFSCGRKEAAKPTVSPVPEQEEEVKAVEPTKRPCMIKFACPFKPGAEDKTKTPTSPPTKRAPRIASPPPPPSRMPEASPKSTPRSHRDSDSTVRNESPKATRKSPAVMRRRKYSDNSDVGKSEATRFHEFASSEDEGDEWIQESTCHRMRLTVHDTLKVENNLRQLAEEVEEEAMDDDDEDDDEDAELDEEADDNDGDREDDDEDVEADDDDETSDAVSDAGFDTDDEGGFADSDDESDAGSDYNWWAPGYSTAATSTTDIEHIRANAHRTFSGSSVGSLDSASSAVRHPAQIGKRKARPMAAMPIRPASPELPDSTDFVCGTLDEDRPLEAAYMSCLEQRRALKHKATPQDIDPSFPASDPEMDEEDEEDDNGHKSDDSDQHQFMHGQMDPLDGEPRGRKGHTKSQPKKRSPQQSPKRLRSPPPAKRPVLKSPPPAKRSTFKSPPPPAKRPTLKSPPPPAKRPAARRSSPSRRLFGHSPTRMRSPPPANRLRSPPPSRRTSFVLASKKDHAIPSSVPFGFGGVPVTHVSSLPRTPVVAMQPDASDDENDDARSVAVYRGAIDIREGLERKRARRREKMYKKHCKKEACKIRPQPGKGAERMREMGLELAAYHKGMKERVQLNGNKTVLMLSV